MSLPVTPFYLPDTTGIRIVKLTDGIFALGPLTSTDSVYVTNGGFKGVQGLTADALGNLYVTDAAGGQYETVYKISPAGLVTHLAGVAGPVPNNETGIGGPAVNAGLHAPAAIALDAAGNVYFDDFGNVLAINMQSTGQVLLGVSIPAGYIANVVGIRGVFGSTGDGGPANSATTRGIGPGGLAFAANGDLYLTDSSSNRVRKVDHATGIINAVAGTGTYGYSGDGGPALNAKMRNLYGLAFDLAGNLLIADSQSYVIRAVNLNASAQNVFGVVIQPGSIATVAGNGTQGSTGDGGAALSATLGGTATISVDAFGNLYIYNTAIANCNVRMVAPTTIISTVAGNGTIGSTGNGGLAINAEIAAGVGFSFAPPPQSAHTLSERNFACNGCFESSSAYGDVLKSLALSMAGFVVPPGDCWRIFAGSYIPPAVSLADTDCRSSIKGDFRLSARDTCNGVKGQYIPAFLPINPLGPLASSPASPAWKKTDFPPVQRSSYIAEDGGVILWKDIQLDFTISLWMAQRIARIVLERLRRQVTVSLPAKLTGLALLAADTMNFFHTRWASVTPAVPTVFQVAHTALRMESQADGVPAFGVDLALRQTDAAVYQFTPPSSPTNFGDYSPYGQTGVGGGNVQ